MSTGWARRHWLQAAAVLGGTAWSGASVAGAAGAAGNAAVAANGQARMGLVLGGGSARGFAHIGVLKSLDQAGIKPDLVVGTSAGALIGALYAAGMSPWQMEEVALRMREVDIADFASAGRRGMLAGDSLARVVNDLVKGARVEQFPRRFTAVATDLHTGETVLLNAGVAGDVVRASCSIPGVFVPMDLDGRELVDGGLVAPLPVTVARQQGADFLLAVDVGMAPQKGQLNGLYEVILQSFEIMGRALANKDAALADVVIRPNTSAWSSSDFSVRKEMIQAGYEATQRQLPEISRKLATTVRRAQRR
jgi:NTE family protein